MSQLQIDALDPWWARNVIYFPREANGRFVPMEPDEPEQETITEREAFKLKHWRLGLEPWQIEQLWQEVVAKRGNHPRSNG